jgi:hypothetical protein
MEGLLGRFSYNGISGFNPHNGHIRMQAPPKVMPQDNHAVKDAGAL